MNSACLAAEKFSFNRCAGIFLPRWAYRWQFMHPPLLLGSINSNPFHLRRHQTQLYHFLDKILCKWEVLRWPSPQGKSKSLSQDAVSGSELHADNRVRDKCSSLSKGQCFRCILLFGFVAAGCSVGTKSALVFVEGNLSTWCIRPEQGTRACHHWALHYKTARAELMRVLSANMGPLLTQEEWKNFN